MLVCMGIWICKIEFRHMFHESQDTCKFRYAIKTIPCCCKLSGANPLHQRHSNSPPLSVWVQVAPRLPRLHYVQSPRFLGDWQQNKTHVGFSQGIPQCKTVSKKRNGKTHTIWILASTIWLMTNFPMVPLLLYRKFTLFVCHCCCFNPLLLRWNLYSVWILINHA